MTTKNQDIAKDILSASRIFETGCINTNIEGSLNASEPYDCESCSDGFVYQVCLALARGDKEMASAIYEFVGEHR